MCMEKLRYNKLNTYLSTKFGGRVLKVCVDGGFTCPNRDGTKGHGGCIYCSELGSGELINKTSSISSQVTNFLSSYRGQRANKFIVYFQNFTCTYDSIDSLKQKYNEALCADSKIIGLSIATRPDCITKEVCSLLSSYLDKYHVSVELGLQTANNKIGDTINRCYTTQDFVTAVKLLHEHGIEVVAHMMIGLPNESRQDIVDTVNLLNSVGVDGVKIHSTYVVKNTKLHDLYVSGNYTPITFDYYVDSVIYAITHFNPNIVIHRITGDAPKDILVAPQWNKSKKVVMNTIHNVLEHDNLHQGMYYSK